MLARSAQLPTRPGYAYEPKMDGYRAILATVNGFSVFSRRRWNMTPLLPELEAFPIRGTFDGELVAFEDGEPDFLALTDRMLLRNGNAPVALVVFDVSNLEGTSLLREPYWKRREILDSLRLAGAHCSAVPSFDDAEALWTVVVEKALEGLVAKPLRSVYRPGERGWLKVKNRRYWKWEIEREALFRHLESIRA